jgi:hypothetical protein
VGKVGEGHQHFKLGIAGSTPVTATKAGSAPRPERTAKTLHTHSGVVQSAGRRPVKAAIGVRVPAPEPRWLSSAWSERRPVKPVVAGSNPVVTADVRVAQMAEHELDTLEVAGSKPAADTKPSWSNG